MALTRTRDGRLKKYDDQECWEKFMGWGSAASHQKLMSWHREKYGTPAKGMGTFWAMWRYAFRNPEKCYPQYKVWFFETASQEGMDGNASFEDFLEDLKRHGRNINISTSKDGLKKFCDKYNLNN